MADWRTNPIMLWERSAGNFYKVSDHNRSPLKEDLTRIGTDTRLADGTLRRYSVAKKRTWSCAWDLLPSSNDIPGGMRTADGGMSGEEMEDFYNGVDHAFIMILRRGSALGLTLPTIDPGALPLRTDDFYVSQVMLTEWDKEVVKRGRVDLWNVSVTLEEV